MFALDSDPIAAARDLCDRHVVKMALESAQILCTVSHLLGKTGPYKPTHARHPVVLWAMASRGNAEWLITHGIAICDEYHRRYLKRHASLDAIWWAANGGALPASGRLQPHAQCMPDQYRRADAVEAYRAYYRAKAAEWAARGRPMVWTGREAPEWMTEGV